ncbi:MAG: cupin domain-containing protein [Marinifilaceae bacterium]|nr:cupin domain-containing protein [Marinifilaceae bacterium]
MKTNLLENFTKINEYFSPKVIGEVNDSYVKIAKIKGNELPWHDHKNEDELFYIIEGCLLMEVENSEPFTMNTGDMYIVKKGTQHRVSAKEECKIMLIENKTTSHTGDVESAITKNIEDQLK